MAKETLKGTYKVKNKEKYLGTTDPRYLSSWELFVFKKFDMNPNVLAWSSEGVKIPYFSTVDNKQRLYLVDLYVKYRDRNGVIHEELIEIKPAVQCKPPVKTKGKRKKTYLEECATFQRNTDKWKSCSIYAKKRGWTFRIITEKEIFG